MAIAASWSTWITGTPLEASGQGTGPVSYSIVATNAAGTSAPFVVKLTAFEAAYPGVVQLEAACEDTAEALVGKYFLKMSNPSKTYFVNCPAGCDTGKLRTDVYGCGGHLDATCSGATCTDVDIG